MYTLRKIKSSTISVILAFFTICSISSVSVLAANEEPAKFSIEITDLEEPTLGKNPDRKICGVAKDSSGNIVDAVDTYDVEWYYSCTGKKTDTVYEKSYLIPGNYQYGGSETFSKIIDAKEKEDVDIQIELNFWIFIKDEYLTKWKIADSNYECNFTVNGKGYTANTFYYGKDDENNPKIGGVSVHLFFDDVEDMFVGESVFDPNVNDSYTDDSGDVFTYVVDSLGIEITEVKDNGDGKLVVPVKIDDIDVYSINVENAGLSSLELSQCTELNTLFCDGNQLSSLDVSKNIKLVGLYCDRNPLKSLDLSNNSELKFLYCYNVLLTKLDVSKNKKIEYLGIGGEHLTSLDVSNNVELKQLCCFGNQLTNLDLSKNTKLEELDCDGTQLTTLNLTNNKKLQSLSITFIDDDGVLFPTSIETLYFPKDMDISKFLPAIPDTVKIYVGGLLYGTTPTPIPTSTPTPTEQPTPTSSATATVTATPTVPAEKTDAVEPTVVADASDNQSVIVKSIEFKIDNNNVATLNKVDPKVKNVTVPNTIKYEGKVYKVTKIAKDAFKNSKAKTITIGKNVTSIDPGAFNNCSKLTTLVIDSNIKELKAGMLKKCKKLKVLKIKSKKLTKIDKNSLSGCKVNSLKIYVNKKVYKKTRPKFIKAGVKKENVKKYKENSLP